MAEIIVVPHTHWDREWYLPFEKYRYLLVRLVDELLDLLRKDREYVHFLLDGQMSIAEDYLEIRSENESRLREEVVRGRIGIGPWYTLPDEFLAGGEGIIRNLLMGHRLRRRLGGVMKIGYIPDPFGHIAQMPQILKGFGIDAAFLMRGVDSPQTEFLWEAPDGSRVLTHFFAAGYCTTLRLREDPAECVTSVPGGLEAVRDFLAARASTDTLLVMNGCDHTAPQPDLTQVLQALNRRLPERLTHGSLADFVARIRAQNRQLPVVHGEMRAARYVCIIPGTLSARMGLKQANHRARTLLEGYAEPLATFAWSLGEEYPASFLNRAWRLLLQTHFHDAICGCGVDEVHREGQVRLEKAAQIAEMIIEDSLERLGRHVATDGEGKPILVFNLTPQPRSERVSVWLDAEEVPSVPVLISPQGEVVSAHVGERRTFVEGILKGSYNAERVELRFRAGEIPPFGYRVYEPHPSDGEKACRGSLLRNERTMENEFLQVEIEDDGTLTITDKATGAVYRSLGYFEDSGDAGDEYNYSPPDLQEILDTRGSEAEIDVAEDEPDWATVRIRRLFYLPEGLTHDRNGRSREKVACQIISLVTLQRGARRVDIHTIVENRARDHRLRVAFPTGIRTEESVAESAFVVVRRPVRLPKGEGWAESPSPTHPQERFVAVEGEGQGLALLNKGLPEYEVTEDGVIHLTLLRCVRWLSRDDLKTRPGHAGPPYETPEAQCLGRHAFEYAIMPYEGDWLEARVWEEAARYNLPLVALRIEGGGKLPPAMSFLKVKPEGFLVSAVKRAEDGAALIVRLYSPTDQEAKGRLWLASQIVGAAEANLNEEVQAPLAVEEGQRVRFALRAHEIKTLRLVL